MRGHMTTNDIASNLEAAMDEAERKAIDSLAVNLNRIGGFGRPNPFRFAVDAARQHNEEGT